MGRRIVATGRGGTGKSTFVALATRYLDPPILLIDLDPDQSLADMVGADLEREKVATISGALYSLVQERKRSPQPGSMALPERMAYLVQVDCLYESEAFDLVTLGTKLTEGCYCAPDNVLRTVIPELAKNYTNVLIDSPAGLEHLNRKVFSDVDDLFVLLDPSLKSIRHVERVKAIAREIGISYAHLYLVGNHRFNEGLEEHIRRIEGASYLGRIDYDARVEEFNLSGRSLLELPDESPACLCVKGVLARASRELAQRQGQVILSYNMWQDSTE